MIGSIKGHCTIDTVHSVFTHMWFITECTAIENPSEEFKNPKMAPPRILNFSSSVVKNNKLSSKCGFFASLTSECGAAGG